LVRVSPQVVLSTLESGKAVLATHDCQITSSFVERLNLDVRQHVAAIGRRGNTLYKHETGLRQQLALFQATIIL
jgi:IS1 family transposase